MKPYQPPFTVTPEILSLAVEIGELVGQINSSSTLSSSPVLRRTNRIRSVYSSLAIEQNTLSISQVTDVLNGKRVIAPPKDIAEFKNAYEIYEHLEELDPFDADDLLKAHGIMVRGLVNEAGEYRSGNVGVVDSKGNILHFGTLPQYIPDMVEKLLNWVKNSDVPMLIKSCVFHYEFEVIHPFADGNGRVGRLWHTLLLSKWQPVFAWLPVESIIHDRQAQYYEAINASNNNADATAFVAFMLNAIKTAIIEAVDISEALIRAKEDRWETTKKWLEKHKSLRNSDLQKLLGISTATASRLLREWTDEGKIIRERKGSYWTYRLRK
ncbi:MAG: Fic family protein [Clostridiales bacterium]|nr:Fic family protein [Clostridiales bacterium]